MNKLSPHVVPSSVQNWKFTGGCGSVVRPATGARDRSVLATDLIFFPREFKALASFGAFSFFGLKHVRFGSEAEVTPFQL